MSQKEKKEMKQGQRIGKIKLVQEIDLKELELIIFHKDELPTTELI